MFESATGRAAAGLTCALLQLGWMGAGAAGAMELHGSDEVVIGKDEIVDDDLYVSAETVTVAGTVRGDLVAWGRLVTVDGRVEGDLAAAGQAVVVNGEVGDDARIAGMTLRLGPSAVVVDDVFAAGFSFESSADSRVGGSTVLAGYQALLSGGIEHDLHASLVGLRLEGRIEGDVEAAVESRAGPAWWVQFMESPVPMPTVGAGLQLDDGAHVGGDLTYTSMDEAKIADAARVVGGISHQRPEVEEQPEPDRGERLTATLRWLGALLIVGWLLVWTLPDKVRDVADTVLARPLASAGWGLVVLVGFPLAMLVVLAATVAAALAFGMLTLGRGAALAVVLGAVLEIALAAKLWLAVVFLSPVVVAFAAGYWIFARLGVEDRSRFVILALGLVLLALFSLVPVLGTALRAVVVVLGLGAGSLWTVGRFSKGESR